MVHFYNYFTFFIKNVLLSVFMEKKTVLIVDDHPLFSKGLSALIESQSEYKVIAEANNCFDAKNIINNYSINLAIVDLNLGDENGLDLIKDIRILSPKTIILVLSMHDERYYAERVLHAGANGYVMKEEAGNKVIDAIKTVMSGKIYLSESETQRLENCKIEQCDNNDSFASVQKLSDRQLQIFTLLGKGLGTVEIASKLNLSSKTVDTHKENIKLKLHCSSSQELRQLAIEWCAKQ